MQRVAASDLGLHYLPIFLLWDARHKRAKGWDQHYLIGDSNFTGGIGVDEITVLLLCIQRYV